MERRPKGVAGASGELRNAETRREGPRSPSGAAGLGLGAGALRSGIRKTPRAGRGQRPGRSQAGRGQTMEQ